MIDAQLPPALARWIAAQGHEAEHVADLGLARASDPEIWQRAVASSAVIVTKDEDFARRRVVSADGPQVIWLRVGNTRRRALLEFFDRGFSGMLVALERNDLLIEVVQQTEV